MKIRYWQIIILILSFSTTKAQHVTGLWEIKQVTVGEETKTPVAKWARIHDDHTFQSGNGWLQNSEGTWTFDEEKRQFTLDDKYGIKDEYGAFTVHFSNGKMIWERHEDGMKVVVMLIKTEKLPMSTADKLPGLWDLTEAKQEGTNITSTFDPENKYYLFIRWDRIYVERTPKGDRSTGYWHIDGHRPEVTLLNHNVNKDPDKWNVSVTDSTLLMIGISDTNHDRELKFKKIHQFPE